MILRKKVYASGCLAGSALLVALEHFVIPRPPAAATVITLRLLAVHYKSSLPQP